MTTRPSLARPLTPLPRRQLPLFLYDLAGANEVLPPAAVLPEQFYSSPSALEATHGVAALMRAILDDALDCWRKQFLPSGHRAQRLAREAEEWFFSDNSNWPFSFMTICAALGLDPEYIRKGLQQWRQQPPSLLQKRKQRTLPTRRFLKLAA
jgi:hypothetical protein